MDKIQKYLSRIGIFFLFIGILGIWLVNVLNSVNMIYISFFMFALGGVAFILNDEISKRRYKVERRENKEIIHKQKKYKNCSTLKTFLIAATIVVVCPIIILVGIKIYVNNVKVKDVNNKWVGYTIGDYNFEPIVVQDELFFPIPVYPSNANSEESGMEFLGYIGSKTLYENNGRIQGLLDGLDYIALDSVWTDSRYENREYLQVQGCFYNQYSKVSCLEDEERTRKMLEKKSSFILMSGYSIDENQCLISKEIVLELESEFGACTYDIEDLSQMEEVYYICVNPYFQEGTDADLKERLKERLPLVGHYIGTIFQDNKGDFYYCNKENKLDEQMTEKIKVTLEAGEILNKESKNEK